MGLESGTFVSDLVTTNPIGVSDPKSEGDDHIRLIKSVLQNTFPGLAGAFMRTAAKAAGYTVLANDNTTMFDCSAALTLSLTGAATLGNKHMFIVYARGGDVVIDPNGAELINGASTVTVQSGSFALVWCTGTAFYCAMLLQNNISPTLLSNTAVPNVPLINGYIEWSIAGNALTIAIKTLAGTDPTATNPAYAVFRDPTLTNGGYFVRTITAATSLVISSGSTLGTISAQASRIYALLMDVGGTVVLGAYNPWLDASFSLVGLQEGFSYSSTAEGGAGAADSAQVIYTSAAQAARAIRHASYMDSTQTVAGTWAQALVNKVQITVNTPKTGARLQKVRSVVTAVSSTATQIPLDDTTPQNTEGAQFMSQAIVMSSASNLANIHAVGHYAANSPAQALIQALFVDSVANALTSTSLIDAAGTATPKRLDLDYLYVANTLGTVTYKIRGACSTLTTAIFNGGAGPVRVFGGVINSYLDVEEIMV